MKKLEKQDRVNVFYIIEDHAKNPKSAQRIFLMIPTNPDKPEQQTQWTYFEAYETILKWAAWLKETHNIQKEEMIAMDFTNKPQFVWLWFGLWSLGAVPAFINYNLRENAFIHCVRLSTARLLLVDPDIEDVLNADTIAGLGTDEKGRAVDIVVVGADTEQRIMSQAPYRAPDEVRSGVTTNSTSLLIYTSGTTGLPKAAKVTWSKPLSGVKFFSKVIGLKPTDRYFTALPLYHSSGSLLGVLQVLGVGCTVSTNQSVLRCTY
jgi:acyl-CoA synthetase (AMP-forming)/AMP-acid ligase II